MHDQLDQFATTWFPIAFPFFFIGIWLSVSVTLGLTSGWFALRRRYPAANEEPLVKRRVRSASMGLGVHLNGMITIAACPSGLRVSVNRLMAPFQPAFLVPWNEIEAEDARSFFVPVVRLRFGRPQVGKLTLGARDWQVVVVHASGAASSPPGNLRTEPVENRAIGAVLLLQWAIVTALGGTFFLLASHNEGWKGPQLPVLLCYGFPAVAFGIPQLFRWITQMR